MGDQWVNIRIKALGYGHRNPWPNGTVVTFAEHLSRVGGQGFRRLDVHATEDDRWVKLPFESIGIVNDNKIVVESYLNQVTVRGGMLSDSAYQWYWVAFSSEILWVRCDWLRPWDKV